MSNETAPMRMGVRSLNWDQLVFLSKARFRTYALRTESGGDARVLLWCVPKDFIVLASESPVRTGPRGPTNRECISLAGRSADRCLGWPGRSHRGEGNGPYSGAERHPADPKARIYRRSGGIVWRRRSRLEWPAAGPAQRASLQTRTISVPRRFAESTHC